MKNSEYKSLLCIKMEDVVSEITHQVPSLLRYIKGDSFFIKYNDEIVIIIYQNSVYYMKTRCLSCFHFNLKGGCGVGSDCKRLCLIPDNKGQGWTNVRELGEPLSQMSILIMAKLFTLLERPLPSFIQEQIPADFHRGKCVKFIQIKPIAYRALVDLDKQEDKIKKKYKENLLPREQYLRFKDEIENEKREIQNRLALLI
ncbi:MAG: hypothetical protein ACTSYS_04060 [Promethearchaeota archaeon]